MRRPFALPTHPLSPYVGPTLSPGDSKKTSDMATQRAIFREPLHHDIDEALIERLVRAFYAKIRADERLGPIFGKIIGNNWEPHLQKMFAFWSSLTMLTDRYKGQPMVAHTEVKAVTPAIRAEDFDIWLTLFRQTAFEICPAEVAPIFIDKAERVAESLKLGMFFDPRAAAPAQATQTSTKH